MAMPQSDFRRVLLMIINSGFDSEELLGILSRRKNWMHRGNRSAERKGFYSGLLWTNMCMHSPRAGRIKTAVLPERAGDS